MMRIKQAAPLFMIIWGAFFLLQVVHIVNMNDAVANKAGPLPPMTKDSSHRRRQQRRQNDKIASTLKIAMTKKKSEQEDEDRGEEEQVKEEDEQNSSSSSSNNTIKGKKRLNNIPPFPILLNSTDSIQYSFFFNNAPDSENRTKTSFRHINNSSYLSNDTMAACLFIMDDTIRLMEWVAYHYTVLPMRRLIVAVDPKSQHPEKIKAVLERWADYIEIDIMYNDTWIEMKEDEGWDRQYYIRRSNGKLEKRPWVTDTNSPHFKSQSHKRRQNSFVSKCLHKLAVDHVYRWALVMDTDEYLVYNYYSPDYEDFDEYTAVTEWMSKEQVDLQRQYQLPLRLQLPAMKEHRTIASYLHPYADKIEEATGEPPRCYRFPHLVFLTPEQQQQQQQAVLTNKPSVDNPSSLLSTLSLTQAGARTSNFSKSLLDLATAEKTSWFTYKQVINVHSPIRRMCGKRKLNGQSGSGADFISSLLRIHHYRAGTPAMQAERSKDYRGATYQQEQQEEQFEEAIELNNTDIFDWYPWFESIMPNRSEVERVLLQPLQQAYSDFYHQTKQSITAAAAAAATTTTATTGQ